MVGSSVGFFIAGSDHSRVAISPSLPCTYVLVPSTCHRHTTTAAPLLPLRAVTRRTYLFLRLYLHYTHTHIALPRRVLLPCRDMTFSACISIRHGDDVTRVVRCAALYAHACARACIPTAFGAFCFCFALLCVPLRATWHGMGLCSAFGLRRLGDDDDGARRARRAARSIARFTPRKRAPRAHLPRAPHPLPPTPTYPHATTTPPTLYLPHARCALRRLPFMAVCIAGDRKGDGGMATNIDLIVIGRLYRSSIAVHRMFHSSSTR